MSEIVHVDLLQVDSHITGRKKLDLARTVRKVLVLIPEGIVCVKQPVTVIDIKREQQVEFGL